MIKNSAFVAACARNRSPHAIVVYEGSLTLSRTPQQLLNDALEMPSPDRGRLAALLIESLESETDADADQAWSEEIDRRLTDIDDGRVKMIPAEEARRMIRGQDGTAAD